MSMSSGGEIAAVVFVSIEAVVRLLLLCFRPSATQRKKAGTRKQTSTKILVRNIPFQANKKEVAELFKYA